MRGIREMALAEPMVLAVNELRTVHFGPEDILAAISLDFEDRARLVDVEEAVTRLERTIKQRFPSITRVFIEAQAREHHADQESAEDAG